MHKIGFKWMALLGLGMTMVAWSADTTPTNFSAKYLELEVLQQKLKAQGLQVVGTHQIAGKKEYTSILYTSDLLKKAAKQPERGFVAVMRILHNQKDQQLMVSNPEYYMRAFLQKDYKEGEAAPLLKSLTAALGALIPTEDALKTKKITKYHFMATMPYYDDFVLVAKGSTDLLCKKLEATSKDQIVFKLQISDDAFLYGVSLPVEIEQFNETLATMGKSQLLPYTVLIENGKAQILHAKYYLALSFPRLTMGEFMKIMSVPNDIKKAFKADFK